MKSANLQDKIIESVYSPELNQLGLGMAEVPFDALLDDGILKDLPIIGSIVALFKGAMDIRDRIFVAKIARFLFNLTSTPLEQRESFRREIQQNVKIKQKVGASLVLILDRLDDIEKPDFLAKCFRAYLSNNISFDRFRRFAAAIDIAFTDDLKAICSKNANVEEEEDVSLSNLARTGLVEFRSIGIQGTWNEMGTIRYSLSALGKQFVGIMTSHDV